MAIIVENSFISNLYQFTYVNIRNVSLTLPEFQYIFAEDLRVVNIHLLKLLSVGMTLQW
jgi:hypothetical protein